MPSIMNKTRGQARVASVGNGRGGVAAGMASELAAVAVEAAAGHQAPCSSHGKTGACQSCDTFTPCHPQRLLQWALQPPIHFYPRTRRGWVALLRPRCHGMAWRFPWMAGVSPCTVPSF